MCRVLIAVVVVAVVIAEVLIFPAVGSRDFLFKGEEDEEDDVDECEDDDDDDDDDENPENVSAKAVRKLSIMAAAVDFVVTFFAIVGRAGDGFAE